MGRDAKELANNAPGQIPCYGLISPLLHEVKTSEVKRRVLIGGIDQDVRVDQEHYRPSVA